MSDENFTMLHINNNEINSIDTDEKLFLSHIGQHLGATEPENKDCVINTVVIEETESCIYQLCYLDLKTSECELNHLATKLMINKQCIYGSAILFKCKIQDDGTCCNDLMTINDYNKILYNRDHHTGCYVSVTGDIIEIEYELPNKLEYIDNWLIHQEQLYGGNGFSLEFVYENKGNVNKIASSISSILIRGNCYILSRYGDEIYNDIGRNIINRLYKVCRTPLLYHKIMNDETKFEEINKLPIVKNKFYMLHKRMRELNNKFTTCWTCDNEIKHICGGCYRLRYCSRECQKNDWQNHSDDCSYNMTKFIKSKIQ
jgi:hypothetical protein